MNRENKLNLNNITGLIEKPKLKQGFAIELTPEQVALLKRAFLFESDRQVRDFLQKEVEILLKKRIHL